MNSNKLSLPRNYKRVKIINTYFDENFVDLSNLRCLASPYMFLRDLNGNCANTDHLSLVGHYPHVLQVDLDLITLDPSLLQARLI